MKKYVGVDYHKNYSYGVIMDEDRQILKQQRFANHPKAVAGRKGANTAKVATARRLLSIVYRVLTEKRDYRPAFDKTSTSVGFVTC